MKVFFSARLSLTAWYLLIIMLISGLFSGYIYRETMKEMEHSFRQMRLRWEVRQGILFPTAEEVTFYEELSAARKFFIRRLIAVNGIVFVMSAVASYYFADKTLRPIEEAHNEQQRFIADASHELRTPLTALKSTIEVALRDKKLSVKEAREVLESSLEEVDGMKALADSLLNLARLPQNRETIRLSNVSISEAVEDVVRKLKALADEKKLSINVDVANTLVLADETLVEEILTILIDNAIKYTPDTGKITITSKRKKKTVYVTVADTGIGIADKDLEKIFDRFYRADNSRSKVNAVGFGLGLPLAKQLVEMHKGKISVRSQMGHGSSFTIELPAA